MRNHRMAMIGLAPLLASMLGPESTVEIVSDDPTDRPRRAKEPETPAPIPENPSRQVRRQMERLSAKGRG